MDIKDIIKTYGKNDYYEMNTGKIYHLSKMTKIDVNKKPWFYSIYYFYTLINNIFL